MSNAEVKGLLEALNGLTSASLPFTPRIWFSLSANRKTLVEQSKIIEDTRLELVKQHGEMTDGINQVPEDKMGLFTKDYNEVLNEKVEVSLTPILMSDLEKSVNKLNGVPNLYLIFEYIIEEGKRTPAKKSTKKK